MKNGQPRFCGNRFQVESPKGCSDHHFGAYEDNRFFQQAKKGRPYELPVFPHEQPGWEMELSNLYNLGEIIVCMSTIEGQLCFTAVPKSPSPGKRIKPEVLAVIPNKQLRLTQTKAQGGLTESKEEEEENSRVKVTKALVAAKADPETFNGQLSYATFNEAKLYAKRREVWARKDAKTPKTPGSSESPVAIAESTETRAQKQPHAKEIMRKRRRV
ncbi:uncharacterized protein K460DRAFT_351374 [Cucurbitaria berberidis CBS 394.84]|uniref:Uncharacterized protein n=1 Tax=Cucurbitaria berberidis CBS 394.84 TaxID=1168544 RepID=A0A9P4LDX7_9PLEO|nr:uncharacterized protein K460DRAFT_351374 [Cucurbitaria berberidis CBS 394.84]KAF1851450.1 hypothetical protein K460DRAFT_351374 [Cucurbitaria berberidis CBS 394.84]